MVDRNGNSYSRSDDNNSQEYGDEEDLNREEIGRLRAQLRNSDERKQIKIGFGKYFFSVRNYDLVSLLLGAFIVAALYMFMQFKKETIDTHLVMSKQMEDTREISTEQHNELVFLLSLTPEQRGALGIQMPQSLANKIYNDSISREDNVSGFPYRRKELPKKK